MFDIEMTVSGSKQPIVLAEDRFRGACNGLDMLWLFMHELAADILRGSPSDITLAKSMAYMVSGTDDPGDRAVFWVPPLLGLASVTVIALVGLTAVCSVL